MGSRQHTSDLRCNPFHKSCYSYLFGLIDVVELVDELIEVFPLFSQGFAYGL